MALGLLAAACGEGPEPSAAPAPDPPPNLVLISLDNVAAGHVGAYGSERDTTPFLDGLAREGVLFETAVSQATWTLPSHTSMLTSRFVGGHGVDDPEHRLPDGVATLPELLRDAGWHTAAFTSCLFVSEVYGLDRGFDRMTLEERPAQDIVPLVTEHLETLDDAPFFLFLHFYDAHQPFHEKNPYGEDFSEGYPDDELDNARRMMEMIGRPITELTEAEITWLDSILDERQLRRKLERAGDDGEVVDERILRVVYRYLAGQGAEALAARRGRYDNGIANIDWRMSQLFAELERFPWFERTVFVITSDHGESFNEPEGILGHGGPPYREQARVPLIVVGPGVARGLRVEAPVALVDVAPTLLDVAGVPAPPEFQGRSLADALRGAPVDVRPIVTGSLESGPSSIRTPEWVLLLKSGGRDPRLFRRGGPRIDRSTEHPSVTRQLRDWIRSVHERNASLAGARDAQAVELDDEARATLRELGYLR